MTLSHLAHELNSLLDGSMRYMASAERALRDVALSTTTHALTHQLHQAREGMQRMTLLLQRAMAGARIAAAVFDERWTISEAVQRCVTDVTPLAHEHGVEIDVEIEPNVATMGMTTLGPVLLNGMKNAIEACAGATATPRRVTVSVSINRMNHLHIIIADTGPGMPDDGMKICKEGGHGLGLELCRQIVAELGGELKFINVPFGGGAELHVSVPVRHMRRSQQDHQNG